MNITPIFKKPERNGPESTRCRCWQACTCADGSCLP